MTSPTLEAVVALSLGEGARAARVEKALRSLGHDLSALEASIRGNADGIRGGRLMVERAGASHAEPFFDALGVLAPREVVTLAARASQLGLPLILGWDHDVAKAYVNASDAAREVREEVASLLPAAAREALPAPHVVGLNVGPRGHETKAYVQDAAPLGDGVLGGFAKVSGGSVISYDVDASGAKPRARFVAVRPEKNTWSLLAALPGWKEDAALRALPFEPGTVRSVGVSDDESSWTVYVKPRGSRPVNWKLEPVECFEVDGGEIGVFVTPASAEQRAFAVVADLALSYRVRRGSPDGFAVDDLMRFCAERAGEARAAGAEVDSATFADPPAPWRPIER